MQKNGAGLQTASSCFWDNTTDGESLALSLSNIILIPTLQVSNHMVFKMELILVVFCAFR